MKIFFYLIACLMLSITTLCFAHQQNSTSTDCNEISAHCAKTPTAIIDPLGNLWVVFVQNNHVYVSSSKDLGIRFNQAVKITPKAEDIYTSGENRPKIALDSSNNIFITWTHKTPGRFSGDIRFSRSYDQGKSFSTPVTINTDKRLIGHRFDSLSIDHDDNIYIAWLDKRDKQDAKQNNQDYIGTAIYYAYSNDHGKTFSENIKIADHTCECCRIASAINQHGDLSLIWRHIFESSIRDHALVTITQHSHVSKINRATHDNWKIDSCPHHGPDLTYGYDNNLYYTWFTQGSNQKGILFGKFDVNTNKVAVEEVVDNSPSASHPQLLNLNNKLIHAWKRFNGESTEIIFRHSNDYGNSWSQTKVIRDTKDASDHPLLIKHNDTAYLSWHTQAEGYTLTKVILEQ